MAVCSFVGASAGRRNCRECLALSRRDTSNSQGIERFSDAIADWKQSGSDEVFDKDTMSVLRASDYLSRDYRSPNGHLANFYVGYYATQATAPPITAH